MIFYTFLGYATGFGRLNCIHGWYKPLLGWGRENFLWFTFTNSFFILSSLMPLWICVYICFSCFIWLISMGVYYKDNWSSWSFQPLCWSHLIENCLKSSSILNFMNVKLLCVKSLEVQLTLIHGASLYIIHISCISYLGIFIGHYLFM